MSDYNEENYVMREKLKVRIADYVFYNVYYGHDEAEIKGALVDAGWPKSFIDDALEGVKIIKPARETSDNFVPHPPVPSSEIPPPPSEVPVPSGTPVFPAQRPMPPPTVQPGIIIPPPSSKLASAEPIVPPKTAPAPQAVSAPPGPGQKPVQPPPGTFPGAPQSKPPILGEGMPASTQENMIKAAVSGASGVPPSSQELSEKPSSVLGLGMKKIKLDVSPEQAAGQAQPKSLDEVDKEMQAIDQEKAKSAPPPAGEGGKSLKDVLANATMKPAPKKGEEKQPEPQPNSSSQS